MPTSPSPALLRIRRQLLSTAYGNADFRYQLLASLADRALAELDRHSSAEAEELADSYLRPEYIGITEDEALKEAGSLGIDTSGWEERRERIRSYTRGADAVTPDGTPADIAQRLWASLFDNYPSVAAALADHLTGLPPTWRMDLFQTDDLTQVPAEPGQRGDNGPETAPYNSTDWEDCAACMEANDLCRFHGGFLAGEQHLRGLLVTLATDSIALEQLQDRNHEIGQRQARESAEKVPERETSQ
ncbi:hypothetical protein [Streptomyces sp. NPDC060366]|uniref:hypothetical protein n=1 Tax=Streptomyces sp. NPDC060366 TaxID=3347105 RepID=UPI00365F642A